MFPLKKSSLLLLPFTLALASTPTFGRSCSGGDCSGGGSSLEGQFLDGRARDNTIRYSKEVFDGLQSFERQISGLPEIHDRFNEFTHSETKKKRFILVDRLPAVRTDDVKHDVADRLVALQRGPVVWVLKDFYDRATDQDKVAFHIHEFLVSEKLRKGPLSKNDMEEVVNVTAHFSERLNQTVTPSARDIQEMLLVNNFQPGLTMREFNAFMKWGESVAKSIKTACEDGQPDGKEYRELMALIRIAQSLKTDTSVNQAKRDHYGNIYDKFNEAVKGDWSRKNICTLTKEAEEAEQLEKSLKLGIYSDSDEDANRPIPAPPVQSAE